MRVRHYWRKRLQARMPAAFAMPPCDAAATLSGLSRAPQPALSWFDRVLAFLTTPFKRFGIRGWKETGCSARATGTPLRDAQHSTDGFWTIDVALTAFSIGTLPADLSTPRYLRVEVEPDTSAHETCSSSRITKGTSLAIGGPVVIDTDADFLEIHPDQDFTIVR